MLCFSYQRNLCSKANSHEERNARRPLNTLPLILASTALLLLVQNNLRAQGAGRAKVLEGNRAYAEEKFDQANDKYRDAQVDNPESPIIHFNVGDALYQKRNYEEALKSYQSAVQKSSDPKLQAQSYYNLGNTLFRLEKLQESIAAYQQALKLNPNDEDAKFNLEYVRRKLKENAQKQPQDQQQQQQRQNQQQQQNQQSGNDQKKDEQQQQQQQNQEQGQDKKDQKKEEQQQNQEQQEQQQGQQAKPGELSKQEAERLLEALQNQEKEAQKKKQAQVRGRVRVDKDW